MSFVEAEELVSQAFAYWPAASCDANEFEFGNFPSIATSSAGPTWCMHKEFNPEGPNSNSVLFLDSDWVADEQVLALTTVSFNVETGEIFGADLEVNTETYTFSRNELMYVLTHEAGHFLGLDHSLEPGALMNESYTFSDAPVALSPDDVAAICTAYEPTRTTPVCNPEPENGYSPDCGGDVLAGCRFAGGAMPPASGPGALGTISALALLWRRRLRSARRTERRIT